MISIQKLTLPFYCWNKLQLVTETYSVLLYLTTFRYELQTFQSISESNVNKMKTLRHIGKDT